MELLIQGFLLADLVSSHVEQWKSSSDLPKATEDAIGGLLVGLPGMVFCMHVRPCMHMTHAQTHSGVHSVRAGVAGYVTLPHHAHGQLCQVVLRCCWSLYVGVMIMTIPSFSKMMKVVAKHGFTEKLPSPPYRAVRCLVVQCTLKQVVYANNLLACILKILLCMM